MKEERILISIVNIVLCSVVIAVFVPVQEASLYSIVLPMVIALIVFGEFKLYQRFLSTRISVANFILIHVIVYGFLAVVLVKASEEFHLGLFFIAMATYTTSMFYLLQMCLKTD